MSHTNTNLPTVVEKTVEYKKTETTKVTTASPTTSKVTTFGNYAERTLPSFSDSTPRNRTLEKICRKSQEHLKKYCLGRLKSIGYKNIIDADGFLYAEGELPVMLIAHMDTVHKEDVQIVYYNDGRLYSPQGIGGDDRCGIYIIFEILKTHRCSVLFTEDEEIGCVGADKFVRATNAKDFNVNYLIEFDRKGNNDAVFYEGDNKDFEKFILKNDDESNGYFEKQWGSFTDICEIAPHLGVSAVNFSSAYYSPHTTSEYIKLAELDTIIEEAKKIIDKPCEKFEWVEKPYSGRNYYGYYDYGYGYGWDDDEDDWYGGYYGYGKSSKRSKKNERVTYHDKEYSKWWNEMSDDFLNGFVEGRGKGYSEGRTEGYNEGYIEGWDEGYSYYEENLVGISHRSSNPSKQDSTPFSEKKIYHILFTDKKERKDKVVELTAGTYLEAVGLFLINNKEYTFQDIHTVREAKNIK